MFKVNSLPIEELTSLDTISKLELRESRITTSSRGVSDVFLKISLISCCPASGPGKLTFQS